MAFRVAASVGLALVVAALGGCGSGGDASGGQSYEELLRGLKRAAVAHRGYHAVTRARALEAPERAVIVAFCKFTSQVVLGHEAAKLAEHAYIYSRIRTRSELEAEGHQLSAVSAAANELRSAIDLTTLDAKSIRDYRRACSG
jgi:hypothetical protein